MMSECLNLRRYTNLAGAIHILQSKRITLLDPSSWDDKNDRFFMDRYKVISGAKSVAALCLAQEPETYHHWRVFSPGTDGVCLNLDRKHFLRIFDSTPEIQSGPVVYKEIKELKKCTPRKEELPFLKRFPYKPEAEFRVIHTATEKADRFPEFTITNKCFNSLVLSPWMPEPLVKSVKDVLKTIPGFKTLRVWQTTVIDNSDWKNIALKAK